MKVCKTIVVDRIDFSASGVKSNQVICSSHTRADLQVLLITSKGVKADSSRSRPIGVNAWEDR